MDRIHDTIIITDMKPGDMERVLLPDLGLNIAIGRYEEEHGGYPYVSINTEEYRDEFTYGDDNGMPIIAVMLGDSDLYDDDGTGNRVKVEPDA